MVNKLNITKMDKYNCIIITKIIIYTVNKLNITKMDKYNNYVVNMVIDIMMVCILNIIRMVK